MYSTHVVRRALGKLFEEKEVDLIVFFDRKLSFLVFDGVSQPPKVLTARGLDTIRVGLRVLSPWVSDTVATVGSLPLGPANGFIAPPVADER